MIDGGGRFAAIEHVLRSGAFGAPHSEGAGGPEHLDLSSVHTDKRTTSKCVVCGSLGDGDICLCLCLSSATVTVDDANIRGTGSLNGYIAHRRAIPSDNSCLFNAIAYLCEGKRGAARVPSYREGSPAKKLRELVAASVLNQPDKYSAAILGKPPQEYVQWIRDPKRWGGSIEIQVLAEYFKVRS